MAMSDTIDLRPSKEIPPKEVPTKKRSSWWGTIIYFVVLAGIVLGLPRFLSWSLHTQYPMAAITSGSMWPVLKVDDLVFIRGGITKGDLKVGDIIVYHNKTNNTLTIHRLVQLNDETFVTRGDANFNDDSPASYADIIGKSLTFFGQPVRIPYLGFVTIFANNLREEQSL